MGYSRYDEERSVYRAVTYSTKSREQIFESNSLNRILDPKELTFREARDSERHPNSVPIIFGLDLTGSMGHIPERLVKGDLSKLMGTIIKSGIDDPALAFIGVGDQYSDRAPLQVGQFESGDAEQDTYLTSVWIESGGGPGIKESYQLAWLVAARHTVTDAWEKRGQKGFLFTVGDEWVHPEIDKDTLKNVLGYVQPSVIKTVDILKEAQEKWHVYHVHINHHGWREDEIIDPWKELLGQNFLITDNANSVTKLIIDTILSHKNTIINNSSETKSDNSIFDLDKL